MLTDAGIAAVAEVYRAWETREKLSRVVTLDEVRAADYNLSPSQFVEVERQGAASPTRSCLTNRAGCVTLVREGKNTRGARWSDVGN